MPRRLGPNKGSEAGLPPGPGGVGQWCGRAWTRRYTAAGARRSGDPFARPSGRHRGPHTGPHRGPAGAGMQSDIFYGDCAPELLKQARPVGSLGRASKDRWLLYQSSIGSPVFDAFAARTEPKLVNYHNITPVELLEVMGAGGGLRGGTGPGTAGTESTALSSGHRRLGLQRRANSSRPGSPPPPWPRLLIDMTVRGRGRRYQAPACCGRPRPTGDPTSSSWARCRPTRPPTTWSRCWPCTGVCITRRPGSISSGRRWAGVTDRPSKASWPTWA